MACVVALPLAMASAGQDGDEGRSAVRSAEGPPTTSGGDTDPKAPWVIPSSSQSASPAPSALSSPLLLGLGLAAAARCGPGLTSPEGVEAQTCLMTQGEDTWARTYYRNATGRALDAVLSLMGPAGRTVQMRCAVGAEDEPETCETPREPTRGTLDAYTAVAEFSASAGEAGEGPLLLRSGSNSTTDGGS